MRRLLLKDAEKAISSGKNHIPEAELPESFRRVGGRIAYIRAGQDAQVDIWTCFRPVQTGWILVPDGSAARPDQRNVEVATGIYRYAH